MSQRNLMSLAFFLLLVFLGILLWKVPRFDLGGVILVTLVAAGYDIFTTDSRSG